MCQNVFRLLSRTVDLLTEIENSETSEKQIIWEFECSEFTRYYDFSEVKTFTYIGRENEHFR